MVIDNVFEIADIVYLKMDKEQLARMVTGILIGPNGLTYRIANGISDTWQLQIELSKEKDFILTTTN